MGGEGERRKGEGEATAASPHSVFSLFTRALCPPPTPPINVPPPAPLPFSLFQPPFLSTFLLTSNPSLYLFSPAPTDWADLPPTAGGPHQGAAGFDAQRLEEGGGCALSAEGITYNDGQAAPSPSTEPGARGSSCTGGGGFI